MNKSFIVWVSKVFDAILRSGRIMPATASGGKNQIVNKQAESTKTGPSIGYSNAPQKSFGFVFLSKKWKYMTPPLTRETKSPG
jgi:hypothetical protein